MEAQYIAYNTGADGTPWGRNYVDGEFYDALNLTANTAWGGRSINDLKGGHYLDYLIDTYNELSNHFDKVDGILYHQGESDNDPEKVNLYYANFYEFVKTLNEYLYWP